MHFFSGNIGGTSEIFVENTLLMKKGDFVLLYRIAFLIYNQRCEIVPITKGRRQGVASGRTHFLFQYRKFYQTTTSYLTDLPAPICLKAPSSCKCCISRVAVALEVFVMAIYFLAVIPPSKPSGPFSSMRLIAFVCLSLSIALNWSKNLAFFTVNSMTCLASIWASSMTLAKY